MAKPKSPLSEAQLLSGNHSVTTKTAGRGFGVGAQVSISANAPEIINITNAPEAKEPEAVSKPEEQEPEAAPVAVSAEQIQEMLNAALAPVLNQVEEAKKAKEEAEAEKNAAIEALNKQVAETEVAQNAAKKAKEEAAAKDEELSAAKKSANALEELGKLTGQQMNAPQTLEVLGTGSQEMRNWQKMIDQAPASVVMHDRRGFAQKDMRAADAYLSKHRQAIAEGIEAEMKEKGFLQGAIVTSTNAPTLMADIPSSSFSYLASEIRKVTQSDLIYRQFARPHPVPGVAPRFQGQVPRYPYNPGPATIADRVLTPGTDISNQSQAVAEDLAPVTILELGLGKDVNNSAIAVTSFVSAFSFSNLIDIVNRNLGVDYARTVDLFCRTIWFGANTTYYSNLGRVVNTPAQVVAGGNGMISRAFLRDLRTKFKTDRVPTYNNGCYGLTLTPLQLEVLVSEVVAQERYTEPTQAQLEQVTRIFSEDSENMNGEVSGYRLTLDGFMIFEQNTHSVGAAGTQGVQSETLGVGARDTETCFAFGADSMCWATALPVEIRSDEIRDFGRRDRYIWYSHENAAALDVNEVIASGRVTQERRVVKLNFTRAAV